MDTTLIRETARQTLDGAINFRGVVANLLRAGVESYHVDYVSRRKTFYAADDTTAPVVTAIDFPDLPNVATDFDAAALKATLRDSLLNGQHYRDFTRRVMTAGVQGYIAFLRGQRVTYFGRQGDLHVEWFPGAQPKTRAATATG